MLERVLPRQKLRIPAADWNAAMDAGQDLIERRARGLSESGYSRIVSSPTTIAIRNDSGVDVPRFGVLGLGDPVIPDDENLAEFQSRILLSGELPDETHTNRFGIVQDWLPHVSGDNPPIGSAVVLGVAIALVETTVDTPLFAMPKVGATDRLIAAGSGAEVLYCGPRDDDDLAWCVVRISPAVSSPTMVKLKQAGGSAGSQTTACSYAYDIYPINGDTSDTSQRLATALQPVGNRSSLGEYSQAPDDSEGLAYVDPDGNWILIWAIREQVAVEVC